MQMHLRGASGAIRVGSEGLHDDAQANAQADSSFGGSRSNVLPTRSRRQSYVDSNGNVVPVVGAERPAEQGVQKLLEHTARYIAEFDRPPRLLRCPPSPSALLPLALSALSFSARFLAPVALFCSPCCPIFTRASSLLLPLCRRSRLALAALGVGRSC
jgi:hypothetical protein